MKSKLLKLSLVSLIIGLVLFGISYYFFHFVTDDGFTLTFHEEAGKPFVTQMIADLGVLFIFTSAISFISSKIFCDKNKDWF